MNMTELFFNALALIGGLALFLYGMKVMGDGLTRISGGRLEKVLESLTKSRLKAVLFGALVTAVIQSSSATTVTVVGFVNSGIMKLSQAVGVIMGANVGTTITSWLLSLTGIESDNFFMRLLKPSSFTPVLALLGIILIMSAKHEKKKDVGSILIGFAVLMYGMEMMSGAVKPLADVPEFTGILTMFGNPFAGMIAGAVLTAIIQSSSASVGILQALCATGSLSYRIAFPIIMGQNIGTCITALLSSVGATKNAKRTALVHLYFNLIGTAVFMLVFYGLHAILDFAFLDAVAGPAGIALIHTLFNVVATILLLPFAGGLEKLALITVKPDESETRDEFANLDERFLDTPSLALEQCKISADKMAALAMVNITEALDCVKKYKPEKKQRVEEQEDKIDRYEEALTAYLYKIGTQSLLDKDYEQMNHLLYCIRDWERISDHACNLVSQAAKFKKSGAQMPKKAGEEMQDYMNRVQDIVGETVSLFTHGNEEAAQNVERMEQQIDAVNKRVKKRTVKRLKKEKYAPEAGLLINELSINLERVADHCENIAIRFMGQSDSEMESDEE